MTPNLQSPDAHAGDLRPSNLQPATALVTRIAHREVRVVIIGLGSVGLPLAVAFARTGLRVTGIACPEPVEGSTNARSMPSPAATPPSRTSHRKSLPTTPSPAQPTHRWDRRMVP
ncbi:MAG TPA: hypothetical protein DEP84_01855 [Chloroflexi bacterium]|nr:hypothetical protein [Chloroflexota bacterium]